MKKIHDGFADSEFLPLNQGDTKMQTKACVVFSRRVLSYAAFVLTLSTFFPQLANAQGFLIEPIHPRPLPRWIVRPVETFSEVTPYKIESLSISATLNSSIAKVDVSQTFKNEGTSTIETSFVFPLPYDGAIDSMTLLVNGKEYPAKLLDAKEARSTYESIVRKNRDPALLEWVGSGMFQTSVFPIPAGETRVVTLSYSQIMRTSDGLTEFLFPMSCAKYTTRPVSKLTFDLSIVGDTELKNVYSPTYDVKIERNGKNSAKVSYTLENTNPTNDFRLFFDQSSEELTAKVQSYRPNESEDGYFLMLATPKIADETVQPLSKTILFALDVSGSMMGDKLVQARDSLKFVLERLRDGDKFNVVLFGTEATTYKPELQTSSAETRSEALAFVDSVRARGGTNIEDALKVSFEQLCKDDTSNPKYVFFLSDGEATVKEHNEMKLASIARESNKSQARLFTFGVGYDVNSRLLDRFVRDGRGQGAYVKPEESIEDGVSKLYRRIEDPVFSEVTFEFLLKGDENNKYVANLVYPSGKTDVFSGEQVVLVGRYAKSGDVEIKARGKVGEKDAEFTFSGSFTGHSEDSSYSYVERLWAARRIGEIVDELDLNGSNEELMNELLTLAKKHGVLTPYTSFLADDGVSLNDASNASRAAANFDALASQTSNASGFMQRGLKQMYRTQNTLDAASNAIAEVATASAMNASAPLNGNAASQGVAPYRGLRVAKSLGSVVHADASMADAAIGDAMGMEEEAVPQTQNQAPRVIGGKTFYFKNGEWIDSTIDAKTQKEIAEIRIKQFSDQYFELISANGQDLSQYLVFTEPVLLLYKGKIYKIETPTET